MELTDKQIREALESHAKALDEISRDIIQLKDFYKQLADMYSRRWR